jgi:hypothetical protein
MGLISVTLLAHLAGCAEPEANSAQEGVEIKTSALGVLGWPQGLDCGLGYYRNGANVAFGVCQGTATANAWVDTCTSGAISTCQGWGCAPGFSIGIDGDRGLCAPWGFYHQQLSSSTGDVTTLNTDQLFLPKGTACGFKDNCNNNTVTCMGFDAAHQCPKGWIARVGSDLNAPSSCNGGPGGFVWCEYLDPNNLCTGDCQLVNQPAGLVCGITDNDRRNGLCLGQRTDIACPAGWARKGWYDDGRSGGHGIGWCTKP